MTEDALTPADHQEINNLIAEVLWRIDQRQGERCPELWIDDGEIWYEGKLVYKGANQLREWGAVRTEPRTIRHMVANVRIVPDGPGRAAATALECVFESGRSRGAGTTIPLQVGDLEWRFVRTHAGWRFAYAHYARLFDSRENAAELN